MNRLAVDPEEQPWDDNAESWNWGDDEESGRGGGGASSGAPPLPAGVEMGAAPMGADARTDVAVAGVDSLATTGAEPVVLSVGAQHGVKRRPSGTSASGSGSGSDTRARASPVAPAAPQHDLFAEMGMAPKIVAAKRIAPPTVVRREADHVSPTAASGMFTADLDDDDDDDEAEAGAWAGDDDLGLEDEDPAVARAMARRERAAAARERAKASKAAKTGLGARRVG